MSDHETVTVRDLITALLTYPMDAEVITLENGGGAGAIEIYPSGETVWDGWTAPQVAPRGTAERVARESAPAAEAKLVEEGRHPGDDYVVAQTFLAWLKEQGYQTPQESTGGGHNEPTTYREVDTASLAERFATRGA